MQLVQHGGIESRLFLVKDMAVVEMMEADDVESHLLHASRQAWRELFFRKRVVEAEIRSEEADGAAGRRLEMAAVDDDPLRRLGRIQKVNGRKAVCREDACVDCEGEPSFWNLRGFLCHGDETDGG